MPNQSPSDILYQLVSNGLTDSAALEDVVTQVQVVASSAGIPEDVATEVINRFRAEMGGAENDTLPRLLVDWGEPPSVGHQVRPEFSLICPHYSARPEMTINVDRDLDHDPNDETRRPQAEESGLWTFHVPFRMTSDGMDCRPGHYLIDVRVSFRDVSAERPRFFRCRIRLNVPDSSSDQAGVLEIDGDGQSMVNLQGYNLKQFSKVILKGGEDSVINMQNALGGSGASGSEVADTPSTTFEYELKIDSEKQSRLPVMMAGTRPRAYLDSCRLDFADGRRVQIFSRPRLTFGRSRDNDVVLRFLPAGEENNRLSRVISRTHFISELTPEGIDLLDQSSAGMEINYSVVRERHQIPSTFAGEHVPVSLGVTGSAPQKFDLEVTLFGPEKRAVQDGDFAYWDEVYCDVLGGRLSRTARAALEARIDAVRYDRMDNLPGQETYVHLLREAPIGASPVQSAILLQHGSPLQARLLHIDRSFWIERMPGSGSLSVDGTDLQPRQVTPLSPGASVQFSNEVATFEKSAQLNLS